jgi:hypothetical protein
MGWGEQPSAKNAQRPTPGGAPGVRGYHSPSAGCTCLLASRRVCARPCLWGLCVCSCSPRCTKPIVLSTVRTRTRTHPAVRYRLHYCTTADSTLLHYCRLWRHPRGVHCDHGGRRGVPRGLGGHPTPPKSQLKPAGAWSTSPPARLGATGGSTCPTARGRHKDACSGAGPSALPSSGGPAGSTGKEGGPGTQGHPSTTRRGGGATGSSYRACPLGPKHSQGVQGSKGAPGGAHAECTLGPELRDLGYGRGGGKGGGEGEEAF